ncbi:SLAP domain-containing protein [Lactobacillus sp. LL6]|uniref:aggregation-promoting factor n=1 Tax=Lactobacillus sp. LL6 TaxID=2596827 RepID=UPI001186BACE|nr:SLAP domain-containing protein [Lactobacillus sp. LL6]TSO26771.1 hypothetical protein FOD82_06845 [Lactobacillus sp. LL6]
MKINSILGKSIAAAALSVTGLVAVNNMNSNDVQAAVVANDAAVYTTNKSTTVYNNYENPVATGQVLSANTSWKVIKTAYDAQGNKWYDLGKNQWVKVETETKKVTKSQNTETNTVAQTAQVEQPAATQAQQTQTYSAPAATQTQTQSSNYTSNATGSEASAKAWIASRESGGSYSATNGQYIGKYQLSASYLNGDYSAANQERVADNYVKSRYGSWTAAQSFWQANGWY